MKTVYAVSLLFFALSESAFSESKISILCQKQAQNVAISIAKSEGHLGRVQVQVKKIGVADTEAGIIESYSVFILQNQEKTREMPAVLQLLQEQSNSQSQCTVLSYAIPGAN